MTLEALYSPDWADHPAPETVVLLLHGYGSNERDLPGIAPYLGVDAPWASVRAPLEMGYGGAAWFPLAGDASRWLDPAPIESATDALWEWIDDNVPATARLVTVGFSQGGMMASQLLRTRPERIKDTVILSGFVLAEPQPADARLAETLPPVFWGRGTADAVVPETLVTAASAWLKTQTTLTEKVYPGLAHSVHDQELADVKAHLTRP
ncbi:dienelactone hydrolase family protein [Demequina sp. TTPB684]|uniref:alpha/beta hydrolase n=1 Tax=unclassified Demequina TaxID=2620311 RepID=UPI001CF2FE2E|nr:MULTISPECIES: dienelactone hydrolase family protein [unclassified Demequina]MCB2412036.1 dienelactone hydrolase family protein [Demequina sp. TTPB684]UPU88849.1 dienelactone hydrolase family protein [Demequina sp. TMPB413]